MKPRKPIPRISNKRLDREFAGKLPYSTIRRKQPCNASDVMENSDSSSTIGTAKHFVAISASSSSKPLRRKRIPKISKKWLSKPAVIKRGVREICNPATTEGRAEYEWRKILMYVRQNGLCCIGREPIHLSDATMEHENTRGIGSSKRDDRICDERGNPMNGVSCAYHNAMKGSRRFEIYHGNNTLIDITGEHNGRNPQNP